MTSYGNKCHEFSEKQLNKFCAVQTVLRQFRQSRTTRGRKRTCCIF